MVIKTEVLSHLDLHSRRMQSIQVVRSRQFCSQPARIETVFVRLSKQSHRHTARHCSEQRVTDADVCEAIHSQIDLLILLIDLRNCPCAVILCGILIGQKVYRWIDRMIRILTS